MNAGTGAGVAPTSAFARVFLGVALAFAAAVPSYAQLSIPSSPQPGSEAPAPLESSFA